MLLSYRTRAKNHDTRSLSSPDGEEGRFRERGLEGEIVLRLDLLETCAEACTRRLEGTRRGGRLKATSHLRAKKGE